MKESAGRSQTLTLWFAAVGVALPILVFYLVVFRYAINIPSGDDYDCALQFVTRLSLSHSFRERLALVLFNQHNEYRTVFSGGVFWLQYALFGKLNFALSSEIGDVVSAGMGLILWFFCLPQIKSLALRLALFIPAALFIFQLNYYESLDAPMTALQHQPALIFACVALICLTKGSRRAFVGAAACMLLSILSSTNGFFLLPVGVLCLVMRKSYLRAFVWSFVSFCALAYYRYRYIPNPQAPPSSTPFLLQWLVLKPIFTLEVLGNALSPLGQTGSLLLGVALVVLCVVLVRRGYFLRHPAMGYCAVFMALTAIGIAHIRLSIAMSMSISSRYRMYSDMLLAFAWFAIAEEWILCDGRLVKPLHRTWLFLVVATSSLILCIVSDREGALFIKGRASSQIFYLSIYENPAYPGDPTGPLPYDANQPPTSAPYIKYRNILTEAIAQGVYAPPQYPARIFPW